MIELLLLLTGLTVSSKVDSVVVYPNQVLLVRSALVAVSGPGELVFEGLSGALNDNTVRIRAPGLRIGEVQVRKGYLAEPTTEVMRLEEKVRMLEDSLKALDDEASVLKAQEEFLASVKLGAPEIIAKELQQGRLAPESWRGALAFVAGELARVKARQLRLGRQRPEMEKRLNAARQEYNEARAAIENRKQVRFQFDAEPGTYRILLSYVIPNAADWQPYYELRARPDKGQVEVSYFAKLAQKTGEDWDGVKVILSTARPMFDVTAPEPSPWYLTLIEEFVRPRALPAPGAMPEAKFAEAIAGGPEADLERPEVLPVETGISLQYVIPGRVSLKSGEPAKKLELKQTTLPAEFEFYTLPKAAEKAFLTGRLVNTSDFVFLSGNGNTYVGEEFTGATFIPTIAQDESLELSFGVDDRVKVKRELVKTFKSRGGLLSRTERAQFVFRTTVENYHPRPITIRIVEQVPVSQQKEIKVTVTRIEPRFLEQDEAKGTYTWKPELGSGERFEINLEFTVEYPAGRKVNGLY
ncbi:MAG: mucoidy inhibitor MuiA family protein [candidate division WOR-3 bacterium]